MENNNGNNQQTTFNESPSQTAQKPILPVEPSREQQYPFSEKQGYVMNGNKYNLQGDEKKPRKKDGWLIAILVIIRVVVFGSMLAVFFYFSASIFGADESVKKYEESGSMVDLIDVCGDYDFNIGSIKEEELLKVEKYFEIAVADPKEFIRNYDKALCKDNYDDADSAYNFFVADYFYLMLKNGEDDKFVSEFTSKMLQYSPSGTYYIDSYTFTYCIKEGTFKINDAQKLVILRGFDSLIAASNDDEEKYMNLQEYYDCCEELGLYDKADKIEKQLNQMDAEYDFSGAVV